MGKYANKLKKPVILFAIVGTIALFSSGCSGTSDAIVLRIINWEDYVYLNNPSYGYNEPDIYDGQFKEYLNENYPEFKDKKIEIIYDTSDTGETMYSKIQSGKANYDLIFSQDYMIQKLMAEDRLEPLDKSLIPNYFPTEESQGYAVPYFLDITKKITTTTYKTKEVKSMYDYSVGYTWGTTGLLFNPTFDEFESRGCNPVTDFQEWTSLLNTNYKGLFSIKNSMRDAYAAGNFIAFDDEYRSLKNKYDAGEITLETYQNEMTTILNRCDQENAQKVFNSLSKAKDNAFGLEVDSGKQDIVTKKIGAQIAWSGDALYSMFQASDRFQVSEPFELYYSLPKTGGNVWFSSIVLLKGERSEEQTRLAHAFLNFFCDPVYAKKNMEYTGYTPAIGGVEIRDYVLDCFDSRTNQIYFYEAKPDEDVYYSIFYQDPTPGEENRLTEAWYSDCLKKEDQDPLYDNVSLKYYEGAFEYDEEGNIIDSDTKELITFNSPKMHAITEKYNERFEIQPSWDAIDLSYVFEGTIEGATADDYIFYCDNYCAEDGEGIVGGQFFAQYPNKETMDRTAVMQDFRENNSTILKLWEEFKSNVLPVWAVILFIIEGIVALAIIAVVVVKKIYKKKLRKLRDEQKATN